MFIFDGHIYMDLADVISRAKDFIELTTGAPEEIRYIHYIDRKANEIRYLKFIYVNNQWIHQND